MQTTTVSTFPLSTAAPSFKASVAEAAAFPRLVQTVVRNMIEAWPAEVYRESLVEARFLGRKTVFVSDPRLIHDLLVTQAAQLGREEFLTRSLKPALGDGILTSDGERWKAQRRTAAPVFRHDRIREFVPAMTGAAAATRARWDRQGAERGAARGAESAPLDVLAEMMRTTFDIIVATMMSDEVGLDVGAFGRAMNAYLDQTRWKMALTLVGAPAWMPHPGYFRAVSAARYLRGTVAAAVASRRQRGKTGSDLLGLMLQARDPEGGAAMSDESLTDNLLTFIAAGHETTAITLAWTLWLLAEHPEVEARVVAEMRAAAQAGQGPNLEVLTYTRQVLMEVMRLYPAAPLLVRKTLGEISLGGTRIPAGRSVHVPVYALHRHAKLWSEPARFDPDRFGPAQSAARDRYAYMPFGAGPRICIGMGFAITECLAILAELLPAYRFSRNGSGRPDARFSVTLRPHGGVRMVVTPRRLH
ncbi:cytochrome P450 [Methylobacterium planeticum]|uniref:Cytochrome P450 n=1 Tax=Methylobacterium planeticum TaxID=2615211 RepID=A0A6N6MFI5_9HYPH|nr:cytochrome P450 [Methylobacterium planeticum]KAB1069611.1 cytochrome P450 [Methylobacterium planeticum]